jgi:hypothetical protein
VKRLFTSDSELCDDDYLVPHGPASFPSKFEQSVIEYYIINLELFLIITSPNPGFPSASCQAGLPFYQFSIGF